MHCKQITNFLIDINNDKSITSFMAYKLIKKPSGNFANYRWTMRNLLTVRLDPEQRERQRNPCKQIFAINLINITSTNQHE